MGLLTGFALCSLLFAVPQRIYSQISTSETVFELYKIKLEERLENRLKERISAILQDEKVIVVVKMRVKGEKIVVQEKEKSKYALPGVPIEKKLISKEEENEASVLSMERIANVFAWIFISKKVPKESLEKIKEISSQILGIDLERGDILSIESYFVEKAIWQNFKNISFVKSLISGITLLLLVVFLFGPLSRFFKGLIIKTERFVRTRRGFCSFRRTNS